MSLVLLILVILGVMEKINLLMDLGAVIKVFPQSIFKDVHTTEAITTLFR